jgi:hypothetical protein
MGFNHTKSLAEVDEGAVNPLISLKYPVGHSAALPGRKAGGRWLFYVWWPA